MKVYGLAIGTRGIKHTAAILEVLHSGVAENEVSRDVTVCGVVHIYTDFKMDRVSP